MSKCLTSEDGNLTVCFTNFTSYRARVRRKYERKYTLLPERAIPLLAYLDLADAMAMSKHWVSGDVLASETMSYYEPTILVEMRR